MSRCFSTKTAKSAKKRPPDTRKHTVLPVSIRLKSTEKTPACVSMWAFLQPISVRIYFGKTASHRKSARFVQSRGALPQAYWMSVKAAQRWGCAKRAFCGVCFLVAGGLKPGALVFVSGFGSVFGNSGIAAAGGAGGAGVRSPGGSSGFTGRTGRGFGGSRSFGGVCAGSGLLASGGVITGALAGLRIIINRRCCYDFFLRLLNDGLFDFDDSGIGNGGYYNVGLLFRNLALKYSINMHIVNETVGVNKAG